MYVFRRSRVLKIYTSKGKTTSCCTGCITNVCTSQFLHVLKSHSIFASSYTLYRHYVQTSDSSNPLFTRTHSFFSNIIRHVVIKPLLRSPIIVLERRGVIYRVINSSRPLLSATNTFPVQRVLCTTVQTIM